MSYNVSNYVVCQVTKINRRMYKVLLEVEVSYDNISFGHKVSHDNISSTMLSSSPFCHLELALFSSWSQMATEAPNITSRNSMYFSLWASFF